MTGPSSPAPLLFDFPAIGGDAPSRASSLSGTPASWPFQGLVPARYRLIAADPAWLFALRSPKGEGKAPQAHYDCMPLDAIKALPMGQLADRRGCLLWLWGTWAMLPEALETGRAWVHPCECRGGFVWGFPGCNRGASLRVQERRLPDAVLELLFGFIPASAGETGN